ncbi:L,D-transpeptidase [Hyphomicrobium facile]|uniref:L,D-transpeptidase catalytic domain n=1 Tax=Hyphomicrobium facile TaxID=51670 RepID=A0A1I7NGV7_9HYPH|nr:L,D-transpeptidase [Hyphomicrobium facile]SFV33868.1 L,D-transpeptidase catalytic domain [Hyphomicrobium facile]
MKSMSLLAAAVLSCAIAAPAYAFHPSEESYGYVAPKKLDRKQRESARRDGQQLFGMGWDWDWPQSNPVERKAPSLLTGGGTPRIAPKAPPTVTFNSGYEPGSIVIDTAGRRLYYVLDASTAYRYPIAVGKQGFAWTGTEKITRKVAWPDWIPPAEMRKRKPELPLRMSGGVRNPLGAMALYLGDTLYRIHGTNEASSIGTATSSGCIRMTNGNVMHLASLAEVGTTVYVLKQLPPDLSRVAKTGSEG